MKILTILLFLSLLVRDAQSREMSVINLTGSADRSDTIVIGKVLSATFTPNPKVSLESGEVFIQVEHRFQGTVQGRMTLAHSRANSKGMMMINAFMPAEFKIGHRYLIFANVEGARFKLTAFEDTLVEIPAKLSPPQNKKGGTDVEEALGNLLLQIVASCQDQCPKPIWMLGQSELAKKPGSPMNTSLKKSLLRLSKQSVHANTLTAVYSALGALDERSVLPRIIAAASAKPTTKEPNPSNLVHWVQNYPKKVRVGVLESIAKRAKTTAAREAAKQQLRYLR